MKKVKKHPFVLAVIPARSGSKGIPKKNLKKLAGKPLIAYTIETALKTKTLNRIIVSTDDEEIAEVSKEWGAEVPFIRPKHLAKDNTSMVPVLQHAVRYMEKTDGDKVDIVVLLQPTSPLREVDDIDTAVKKLLATNADSVITVCEIDHLSHPHLIKKLENDRVYSFLSIDEKTTRRQDLPLVYRINALVYVVRREVLMEQNTIFGADTRAVVTGKEKSLDIDTELDFCIAEALLLRGGPTDA